MKSYQANDARLKMREILTAAEHGEHVQIKRYDTATAMVVPHDWWLYATDAVAVIGVALERGGFTTGDMEYLREARSALGLEPPSTGRSQSQDPADPKENDR